MSKDAQDVVNRLPFGIRLTLMRQKVTNRQMVTN
jgi:hypothetical protein